MNTDPRSEAVRLELGRVVRRWQQLPLDRASALCAQVRTAAAELDALSGHTGVLPELSPAATIDQLKVTAYDACAAGHGDEVAHALVRLRRVID